jgi:diadenosine tetraphosphate (Ap4A) HIT family hydrolase
MPSCPFCQADRDRVLLESEVAVSFLDAYPVTEGHTLISPRQHVTSIYQLSTGEQSALWAMVGEVRALLVRRYAPDAFNIAVNDGILAGQTIEHAHIHVIPRRKGDVLDARGGVRNIIPDKARYWET